MSSKRRLSSPLNSPPNPARGMSLTLSNKRRKSEHHLASAIPVHLKGMKAQDHNDTGAGGKDDPDAEGGEGDEDAVVMEEDDYATQAGWQGLAKQNLKVLMESFTPEQHERYEQYRRSAINKNTVRKFIHTTFGTNPSMNVAQVVAGFSKVFVGEMVEKAREVQASRGESGPLAPDDLRQAYRMYVEENGKVGVALPHRGKRLFVR
ncbi:hypothetical protein FRB95_009802 [Tulasnella sp. JGI-2019a]|nr:hypothetical protein FRB95_009802 [Tulasnella sp. JGI-2019a]